MASKRLNKNLKIKNFLVPISKIPVLYENDMLKDALEKMSKLKYGICFCIKKNGNLAGVLTDGDVRRKILNIQKPFSALLGDDLAMHTNRRPSKAKISDNVVKCLKIMEKKLIWDLPVVDKKNKLIGMLHLHPIVKRLML